MTCRALTAPPMIASGSDSPPTVIEALVRTNELAAPLGSPRRRDKRVVEVEPDNGAAVLKRQKTEENVSGFIIFHTALTLDCLPVINNPRSDDSHVISVISPSRKVVGNAI